MRTDWKYEDKQTTGGRVYAPEEKRPYEKIYEATTGGEMNADNLVDAVRRMRAAQKQYFKTKDYASLCEAKKLETEVDKMLKSTEPDEQLKLDF